MRKYEQLSLKNLTGRGVATSIEHTRLATNINEKIYTYTDVSMCIRNLFVDVSLATNVGYLFN